MRQFDYTEKWKKLQCKKLWTNHDYYLIVSCNNILDRKEYGNGEI